MHGTNQTSTVAAMNVGHFDGDVTITLSPDAARALAGVWGNAHAVDPVLSDRHPAWDRDMAELLIAAARADYHAGAAPAPVEAVLLPYPTRTERPRLEGVPS